MGIITEHCDPLIPVRIVRIMFHALILTKSSGTLTIKNNQERRFASGIFRGLLCVGEPDGGRH
jgi:hypothetical protein